jgi:hypothetical protein
MKSHATLFLATRSNKETRNIIMVLFIAVKYPSCLYLSKAVKYPSILSFSSSTLAIDAHFGHQVKQAVENL